MDGSATNPRKRVLVVEDHPLMREGIKHVVNGQPDLVVCGEAASAREVLPAVVAASPDVILLDLMLGNADGIELIRYLTALRPGVPILVISFFDESIYAERALRAGARGFIMKGEPVDEALKALRCVIAGGQYLGRRMQISLASLKTTRIQAGTHDGLVTALSDRELHVFGLIGLGEGNRQMAATMNLSVKTIEAHREHIKVKLKLKDSIALVAAARVWVNGRAGTEAPAVGVAQHAGSSRFTPRARPIEPHSTPGRGRRSLGEIPL
jgi:DNA-binding NarL/FixJ family response regulator